MNGVKLCQMKNMINYRLEILKIIKTKLIYGWKEVIELKIFIICSKAFYKDIAPIKEKLEQNGHIVELPNSYYEPDAEKKSWDLGEKAHSEFKARMFKMSEERIATMDAVLTLNFDKNGKKNYIGGATFIEIYEAFKKGKKIFLYNDIPEGMLYDEISGFSPIVIKGDLDLI